MRAYILKLVQWAIASRPSRVEVEVNRKRVRVWHNGEPTDFKELLQAGTLLLSSGPLGHLAIGLNTARTLKPGSDPSGLNNSRTMSASTKSNMKLRWLAIFQSEMDRPLQCSVC